MRAFSSLKKQALAAALLAVLLVPAALTVAPRPAHAQVAAAVVSDTSPSSFFRNIKEAASALFNGTTAQSTAALNIKAYVLDPIVRIVAQVALKALTASVINWINGQGSGGSPQFVQNLGLYLLVASDNAALHFFAEVTGQSNSPFAPVIASSLRTNYLQSTSAAGFWAANKCTLSSVSPNIQSFLAGNFRSQGGWAAWFSLTTMPQNNPYSLYFRSEAELNARIAGVQGQQQAKANWGQGFLSWCGSGTGGGGGASAGGTCTTDDDCGGALACIKGKCAVDPSLDIPSGQCINKDGSQGTIQTPGSVISSSINKSLGAGQDSLISAHSIDESVDAIFAALVTKVLSTGLSAISGSGNLTDQLRNGTGLGTPTGTGTTTGADLENSLRSYVQSYTAQVGQYQTAWITIQGAANTASSSVAQVLACEAKNGGGDVYGAQAALDTEVGPILAQAASAATTVASSTAAIRAVGLEISSASTTDDIARTTTDVQALLAMPPSVTDAAQATQDATTLGGATSTSQTSLQVAGGSIIDQMNLINTHGANALEACETPIPI